MTGSKANRRRELFLQAMAAGAELEAAAAAADYSPAYARRIWQQSREKMAAAMPAAVAEEPAAAQAVAGREEVLSFLTDLLRATAAGGEAGVKERLKAAELLGKGNGAFQPQGGDNHLHIEIEVVE